MAEELFNPSRYAPCVHQMWFKDQEQRDGVIASFVGPMFNSVNVLGAGFGLAVVDGEQVEPHPNIFKVLEALDHPETKFLAAWVYGLFSGLDDEAIALAFQRLTLERKQMLVGLVREFMRALYDGSVADDDRPPIKAQHKIFVERGSDAHITMVTKGPRGEGAGLDRKSVV